MKSLLFSILIIVFLISFIKSNEETTFENHQVLRIKITTEEQLKDLVTFEENQKIDLWSDNFKIGALDIRISNEFKPTFEKEFLFRHQLEYSILVYNVQDLIDKEKSEMKNKIFFNYGIKISENETKQFFDNYRTIAEINNWMKQMAETHPDICSLITDFGKSYEGRDIQGLKIGKKTNQFKTSNFNSWWYSRS